MNVHLGIIILAKCWLCAAIEEFQVKYYLYENPAIGTRIGSLSTDLIPLFGSTNKIFQSQNLIYKFSLENKYFDLHEKSGTIVTKSPINLEEMCSRGDTLCRSDSPRMICTVNVWDNYAFVAIVRTVLYIEDENDNFPTFQYKHITKRINEINLKEGRKIFLPQAVDNDILEKHRQIIYNILQFDGDYFRLNVEKKTSKPFVTLLKDLDAENNGNHTLILEAWNEGFLDKKSQIIIEFEVLDFNDNEPYFNVTKITITVRESTPITTNIYKIKAFDADRTAKLVYRLDGLVKPSIKQIFSVQEDGTLVLINRLDYETDQTHEFVIEAYDGVYAASVSVIVKVIDINDESPIIQIYPNRLSIKENLLPGVSVGQVKITDKDSPAVNGKIYCKEPDGMENQQLFTFHPDPSIIQDVNVFEIKSRTSFDREEISGQNGFVTLRDIKIICSDGHKSSSNYLTSTFTITVTIADDNDNKPIFAEPEYKVMIFENNHINAQIHQIMAIDKDEGSNGEITYSIIQSSDFKIDSVTGWLSASRAFDREEREKYMVEIIATDNGSPPMSSIVKVNITIGDRNDNAPELISPTEISTEENRDPSLGPVEHLKAKDDDADLSGSVVFHQMWPNDGWFEVNQNGTIFAKSAFDREQLERHCLKIRISDLGTENQQHTIVAVCIKIIDVNDNVPQFVEPIDLLPSDNIAGPTISPITPIDLSIYEIPGELIVKVKAIDLDSDNNGKIFYSLKIPLGFPRLFEIDREVGEVKVSQTLSRGDIGFYRVHIIASDNGSPPLSDIKVLSINLVDEPPGFGREKKVENTISRNWKRFGTTNNIVIVAILSVISGILVIVLITVILCMLNPCKFHRNRGFSSCNMSQWNMYPHNKNCTNSKDLELSSSNYKQYGEFCTNLPYEKENNSIIIPSNLYDQFSGRFYSTSSLTKDNFQTWMSGNNLIGSSCDRDNAQEATDGMQLIYGINNDPQFNYGSAGANICCVHNAALSPFIQRQPNFQTIPYDAHLTPTNDEQHSDSGRGGSDEDLSIGIQSHGRLKFTNNIRKINNICFNTSSFIQQPNKVQCHSDGDCLSIVGEETESKQNVDELSGNYTLSEKENNELTNICGRMNDRFAKNL